MGEEMANNHAKIVLGKCSKGARDSRLLAAR